MKKKQHRKLPPVRSKLTVVGVGIICIVLGSLFLYGRIQAISLPYYRHGVFSLQPGFPTPVPDAQRRAIDVPILLYHYVEYVKDEKDTIRQQLNISPWTFERQIQTLADASYTGVFMDDLADMLDGKKPVSGKPVIFTFDDGYEDFYTDVFPILKKYGMKATVYVVYNFLDTPNYMSGEQVREIAGSGLVEVASHTLRHMNLSELPAEVARQEIWESKTQLEALIGREVRNFAYPYGSFTPAVAKLAEEGGYRTAASVVAGSRQTRDNRYYLFRLRPGNRIGDTLLTWLENQDKYR